MKTVWLTKGGTTGHWQENEPHKTTIKWYREYVPKDAYDELVKILKIIHKEDLTNAEIKQLAYKALSVCGEK